MYYLHAESQEKYFEGVIRLHKSGCSNGAISRLLPVGKTIVSKWISIFVREKGQIMRVKRTEKLVDPEAIYGNCMLFCRPFIVRYLQVGVQFSVVEVSAGIACVFPIC